MMAVESHDLERDVFVLLAAIFVALVAAALIAERIETMRGRKESNVQGTLL